ncbi:hypothetical protein [Thermodesulfovibrio thiophilus]|uniref:hypothetical protein n=1 Tax=Thermodesulfovibrio thiophilus TaxID=340095 RepID=UPI0003F634A1|nr:hypothetical protein [Thermodesulfovibrio thiophilus]
MPNQRQNLEQQVLEPFEKCAHKHGYPIFKGQGRDNRICVDGNTYFQFGDLRVDTPYYHVIIEVETAGGVTNLVKYWYCLESQKQIISKPIVLLHIFKMSSESDYGSHLSLWDYLWDRMAKDLKNRMQAKRFKIGGEDDKCELDKALKYFKEKILENKR